MFSISFSAARASEPLHSLHFVRCVSTASAIQRGIGRSNAAPTQSRRNPSPLKSTTRKNTARKGDFQSQRGKSRSREPDFSPASTSKPSRRLKVSSSTSVPTPAHGAFISHRTRPGRVPKESTNDSAAPKRGKADQAPPRDPRATKGSISNDKRKHKAPVSIPYTTPASEFLYGRSVVEAALKAGKRKLHKLYFNNIEKTGTSRLIAEEPLIRLANAKGVEVKSLRREDAGRLLDAMSGGRPHNVSQRQTIQFWLGIAHQV